MHESSPDGEQLPARNRRFALGLTSRRKALIEKMIFDGLPRKLAAEACGMTDRNARMALANPSVMAFYRQQLRILRESEKPKSVHRLVELRDQDRSLKVSLEAARELARDDEGTRIAVGVNVNIQPGYIVQVPSHIAEKAKAILAQHGGKTIDAEPLRDGDVR